MTSFKISSERVSWILHAVLVGRTHTSEEKRGSLVDRGTTAGIADTRLDSLGDCGKRSQSLTKNMERFIRLAMWP